MKDYLRDVLKNCKADYADIRFETRDSTSFAFRGKEQEGAGTSKSTGGIVRACVKGGWGMISFDSLDGLKDKLDQAYQFARLVGNEKTMLAESEPVTGDFYAVMKDDFRGRSLDEKVAAIEAYNSIIMKSSGRIESSFVKYRDVFRTVHFASTTGACFMEERPFASIFIAAVARKGDLVQKAFKSLGSTDDFGVALGKEELAAETAERADQLLDAPKCQGGRTTVILDPAFTGLFTHEAFGHLSEADFLYENPKMRELMHLGRKVGPDFLNIVDNGTLPGCMGTHYTDDEGTQTQKTVLVRNGILAGHLHSKETAAKMGEKNTGNARAISGGVSPIVRMTNTYIEPGPWNKEDLFKDVEDGIYACEGIGGQTMMEMFTFSASYGYKIKNGKLDGLVRDVMVTGNVFETLQNIDAVANDFTICKNGGGCGKGGQSPLPVSHGGPHIRIRNAVVAGDK